MTEIITRQGVTPGAAAEPSLTLSQMTALLQAATDYAKAQRPVVLHGPAQPATAPQTAQHPGVDIRIPAAPAVAAQPRRERNPWPLVFMVSGCTGLAACLVTAVTDNPFAILATLAALAVWGTATYQLVFVREP